MTRSRKAWSAEPESLMVEGRASLRMRSSPETFMARRYSKHSPGLTISARLAVWAWAGRAASSRANAPGTRHENIGKALHIWRGEQARPIPTAADHSDRADPTQA